MYVSGILANECRQSVSVVTEKAEASDYNVT